MTETKIKVVGFGAGGHAKVLLDALRRAPQYEVVGLLDPQSALHGAELLGVKVLGSSDKLETLCREGVEHFFLGTGSVGDATVRRTLWERAVQVGLKPITIVHPSAVLSPTAHLGDGATVLAGAIINSDARVGHNVLVNTHAVVEHDCQLGDHVHVASGAVLAGGVTVGEESHIGAGAVVREGITIGSKAVVGIGTVVVREVADATTVIGNPARLILGRTKT